MAGRSTSEQPALAAPAPARPARNRLGRTVHGVLLVGALGGVWLSLDLARACLDTGAEEDSLIWPVFAGLLGGLACIFAWEAWRRLRALRR